MADDKTPDWTASEERAKVVRFLRSRVARLEQARVLVPTTYRTLRAQMSEAKDELLSLMEMLADGEHNDA